MRLVKIRNLLETEYDEETFGILVEDEDNTFGYGGDFVISLDSFGIFENEDYEIVEDNVQLDKTINEILQEYGNLRKLQNETIFYYVRENKGGQP